MVESPHDLLSNDSDDDDTIKEEDADETTTTSFEQLMNSGSYLCQLRLLALADEQNHQAQVSSRNANYCDAGIVQFSEKERRPHSHPPNSERKGTRIDTIAL